MSQFFGDASSLDLSAWIRDGDGVVWGQASAEPPTLTALLGRQAPDIGRVSCFLGTTASDSFVPNGHTALSAYCASGRNRQWIYEHGLTVVPAHYSALPRLFGPVIRADVVMLLLAPPGDDGTYRIGLADEYLSSAIDQARVVLAEVSPFVPVIPGSRALDPARIDVVLHSNAHPPRLDTPGAGPVDLLIASQVSALVKDGATLQIGLGSLPAAILTGLCEHNDLGVHSGLIGDAVVDLVEAGVITNRAKSRDRGATVTGTIMGTERVFDFVDNNPTVILRDTGYTHDQQVLASHQRFTAINSAIEVDLSGQINTEVAAGRYVGAVGGVADFLRGAHASPEGLPITALASTARNGASRIVSRLSGPASVSRADAGVIVTEHGSADLRGRTLAERRRVLLEIADPGYRDELAAQPFDPYT